MKRTKGCSSSAKQSCIGEKVEVLARNAIYGIMGDGGYVLLGSDRSRERAKERGRKLISQFRKKEGTFGIELPSQMVVVFPRECSLYRDKSRYKLPQSSKAKPHRQADPPVGAGSSPSEVPVGLEKFDEEAEEGGR